MGELPYWTDIVENGIPFVLRYFMWLGLGLLAGVAIIAVVDRLGWPRWLAAEKGQKS